MTNLTTESSSTRPRLNAPQYGLALFKNGHAAADLPREGLSQTTRVRNPRAAILQTPARPMHAIPQAISVRDLLALSGLGACDMSCDATATLPCEARQLEAGALLYEQVRPDGLAFIILNGVLVREQMSGTNSTVVCGPSPVSLSGAKELIGLHFGTSHRSERATAITQATVLAFPIKGFQATAPSSTLINDLFMRTAGAALLRDWRVAYRLRDLPALSRTVAGLSYLTGLAEFKPAIAESDGTVALAMPVSKMATWLGSDEQVLRTQLKSLERYGVVACSEEFIRWLDPIKLETLWGFD